MKLKLILTSLAALVFGRPAGFSTANAAEDKAPDNAALAKRLDALEAENTELKAQIAAKADAPAAPAEASGTLALLAKGAGVELADCTWRVSAGLDEAQAVEAALSQKAEKERRAAAEKAAKKK